MDLRTVQGLTQQHLEKEPLPLLCNVLLPENLGMANLKDRNCEAIATALHKRYPQAFETLDAAKAYVEEQRKKTFD